MRIKNIYGEKSHLFTYLRFFAVATASLCLLLFLCLLSFLVRVKSCCKRNIKRFEIALMTSFNVTTGKLNRVLKEGSISLWQSLKPVVTVLVSWFVCKHYVKRSTAHPLCTSFDVY